jgi:hypothetical protein
MHRAPLFLCLVSLSVFAAPPKYVGTQVKLVEDGVPIPRVLALVSLPTSSPQGL